MWIIYRVECQFYAYNIEFCKTFLAGIAGSFSTGQPCEIAPIISNKGRKMKTHPAAPKKT